MLDVQEIIINKYLGGLGNQMFQYAFGLNLEKQGKKVIADTSWHSKMVACILKYLYFIDAIIKNLLMILERKVYLISWRHALSDSDFSWKERNDIYQKIGGNDLFRYAVKNILRSRKIIITMIIG